MSDNLGVYRDPMARASVPAQPKTSSALVEDMGRLRDSLDILDKRFAGLIQQLDPVLGTSVERLKAAGEGVNVTPTCALHSNVLDLLKHAQQLQEAVSAVSDRVRL